MITGNNLNSKKNLSTFKSLFKSIVIGLVLLGFSQNSLAQQDPYPDWENFTNKDHVLSIAEEGNYLWIGTTGGLVKFNKSNSNKTYFTSANSKLPGNEVYHIAVDQSGNKWIGTDENGLVKYDGSSWTIFNRSNSNLPANSINEIKVDNNGDLWVGTEGLVKYNGSNWTVYDTSNSGLPANSVSAIAIDNSGDLWIGSSGLVNFDGNSWNVYNASNFGLPRNNVGDIAIDDNGNKWIAIQHFNGSLVKFDGNNWTKFKPSNSDLSGDYITDITFDGSGNLWINANRIVSGPGLVGEGLDKYNGNSWTNFNANNSELPHDNVTCIFTNNSGTKWIGTENQLAKLKGGNWNTYELSQTKLHYNQVVEVATKDKNNLWIGTGDISGSWGEGFARYNGNMWKTFKTNEAGLFLPFDIKFDKSGTLWSATSVNGIVKYDGNQWKTYDRSNTDIDADINSISSLAIKRAGTKWFASDKGLVKYDGSQWSLLNKSNSKLPSNQITAITIDASSNKWIGTGKGLVKYDGSNWEIYDTTNSQLPNYNNIETIAIDGNGNVWIGTEREDNFSGPDVPGSLIKYSGSDWTIFDSTNSNLKGNSVNNITIDGSGKLWVATGGTGLVTYDGSNWKTFNVSNSGLASNTLYDVAIDNSGSLWIGTGSGLSKYKASVNPPTSIESKKQNYNISIHPNPAQNQLKIQTPTPTQTYTLHTLTGQQAQSGKLSGKGTHTLDVSNLSPGVYLLEVQGEDAVRTKKVVVK